MDKVGYISAFLGLVGLVSCIVITSMFIIAVYQMIKDIVGTIRHKIGYKRRFKVKPTAACYCADCRKWNQLTGECSDHCNSRIMSPNWFCCFADPLTKREQERRNQMEDVSYNDQKGE